MSIRLSLLMPALVLGVLPSLAHAGEPADRPLPPNMAGVYEAAPDSQVPYFAISANHTAVAKSRNESNKLLTTHLGWNLLDDQTLELYSNEGPGKIRAPFRLDGDTLKLTIGSGLQVVDAVLKRSPDKKPEWAGSVRGESCGVISDANGQPTKWLQVPCAEGLTCSGPRPAFIPDIAAYRNIKSCQ
jgi:hypothetical protein